MDSLQDSKMKGLVVLDKSQSMAEKNSHFMTNFLTIVSRDNNALLRKSFDASYFKKFWYEYRQGSKW
jgi:hypothetical protein